MVVSLLMKIFSYFGQRRTNAQAKYFEFVQTGIGNPSIWDNLKAQSPLGVEEFGGGTPTPGDGEATNSRYPRAKEFGEAISQKPGQNIQGPAHRRSHHSTGYSQMQAASFLGLHYSTISRIATVSKRKSEPCT
jgi:hypothetical protein